MRAGGSDASTPTLPGYVLSPPIASGGMGTVHLGLRDEDADGRPVAVKRLHEHLGSIQNFRAMFRDEAWLTSRIRHPNIVAMFGTAEHDRDLFLVMEYIHGEALCRCLGSGPLPAPIASAILCDVLRGLQACHEAHDINGALLATVHRDLSPHNILVGADGRARIIDFGIAKFSAQAHQTTQGRIRGKLAYLAPEQVLAKPATHKTDLFAVGIAAFELFSGKHPYADRTGDELIAAVSAARLPDVATVAPMLPREAANLIASALARNPSRRPASAAAMLEGLLRALPPATPAEVASWIEATASDALATQARMLDELRNQGPRAAPVPPVPARSPLRTRLFWPVVAGGCATVVGVGLFVAASASHTSGGVANSGASATSYGQEEANVPDLPSAVTSSSDDGPTAIASPKPHRRSHPATLPAAGSVTSAACEPPYYLDERLHKRYRPECLRAR